MPSRWTLLLIFSVLAAPGRSGAQATGESSRYILWHLLPAAGATSELTAKVESQLRRFFEQKKGRLLMDAMTMDSLILVEGNEKYLRCGTGPACISGLGELAGIPWVIAGEVRLTGGRVVTELVLVDTAKKSVASRASVESGGPPGRNHMEELAVAMFEPERYKGSIELSCAVAGAEVFLDGERLGETPLAEPLSNLAAGNHNLEVKKLGHQPFARQIRVAMGETKRVVALLPEERLLREEPTPFYKHWAFYSLGGVGVASTVLAIVLHLDAMSLDDDVARLKEENPNSKEYQERKDLRDARYTQTYVAYAVGGAGLLAAGVLAILDLTGNETDRQGETAVEIGFAPQTSGLGMTVTLRF